MGARWARARAIAALAVIGALIGVAFPPTAAAIGSGSISGTVRNDLGEPIASCPVVAQREAVASSVVDFTSPNGTFRLSPLSAGAYTLFASCAGDHEPIELELGVDEHRTGVQITIVRRGLVSGAVTDHVGTPVRNACVQLRGEGYAATPWALRATTDDSGAFTVREVPPGEYRLVAGPCPGEPDEVPVPSPPIGQTYLGGASTFDGAAVISVGAGEALSHQVISAQPHATVTGTITLSSGAGLSNPVCVEAYPGDDGLPAERAMSTLDGSYSLTGLGEGPHDVRFCGHDSGDPTVPNHQPQWYPSSPDRLGASPVDVARGGTTPNVDVMLGEGGAIAGRVSDTAGEGVLACLSVFRPDGSFVASTRSFHDVDYRITGLAQGTYRLHVDPTERCEGERFDLMAEYHPDASRLEDGADIAVVDGTTTRIDVTLEPERHDAIVGTVLGPESHPAAGICVRATGPDGHETFTETGHDGAYGFGRLAPGAYQLAYDVCPASQSDRYEPEYWNDAIVPSEATHVAVGDEVRRADAQLAYRDRMAIVTGTVTAQGVPSVGECVSAYSPFAPYHPDRTIAASRTSADGSYVLAVRPLPPPPGYPSPPSPQQVKLRFGCGPDAEWHEDKADFATADAVTVSVEAPTTVDADLTSPGEVTGTVIADGAPVGGSCVRFAQGGVQVATATSGVDGSYHAVLGAGTYEVSSCDIDLVPIWFEGAATAADATPVVVSGDSTTSAIDLHTSRKSTAWGRVSGTVRGEPGTRTCVEVLDPDSLAIRAGQQIDLGSQGSATHLSLYVPPGAYLVRAGLDTGGGCVPSNGYGYFRDATAASDATPVQVAAGQTLHGVDLDAPRTLGTVRGTVTDAGGAPVPDLCVRLLDEDLRETALTTDADGTYTADVPPGVYSIVIPCYSSPTYVSQHISGVQVAVGSDVVRDVTVARYGRIEGRVTAGESVCVRAYAAHDGRWLGGTCPGWASAYSLVVPPGDATVEFRDAATGEMIWYDATTAADADIVHVPDGGVVGGIDVAFDAAPVVAITAPVAGETVRGPVELVVDATDDQGVVDVEFTVDGMVVGTDADGADGWSVRWSSAGVADGQYHRVGARARDARGQRDWDERWIRVVSASTLDFDGDGDTDVAVHRPAAGAWHVRDAQPVKFGPAAATPVPSDYDGDGSTEYATYQPTSGRWDIQGLGMVEFGAAGAAPVPADYDGDGDADVAVFRPGNAQWDIRGIETVSFGQPGAIPVPADYDGDGDADLATYHPVTGRWQIRGVADLVFGGVGALPVPADYDGDGDTDIATFRPATARWEVLGFADTIFGGAGDTPLPADYDGDGVADLATYRPLTSRWLIRGTVPFTWGTAGDTPLAERH